MACRIGITTDLESRKEYWESIYKNLRNWQVLAGPYDTKEEAQTEENRLAAKHGCEAHPGGADDEGDAPWYVYGFDHSGKK